MAWNNNIMTSLFGRRLGLQALTTSQSGGSRTADLLVGPDAIRLGVTTAESTGTNVAAHGISILPGTSAASTNVYTLDPPIPGVRKYISLGTTASNLYLKTANSETIQSTLGTSFTTIRSSVGGSYELIGLTTAVWMALGITSGTSSQASGFVLTTST